MRADATNIINITNFISTANLDRDIHIIEDEGVGSKDITFSQSDKKVISLWDDKFRIEKEHIMLRIPWKQPDDSFPNNTVVAMSRLMSLRTSLERKGMYNIYEAEVKSLLKNGHAEPVSEASEPSK